jgi:hypothetical protein
MEYIETPGRIRIQYDVTPKPGTPPSPLPPPVRQAHLLLQAMQEQAASAPPFPEAHGEGSSSGAASVAMEMATRTSEAEPTATDDAGGHAGDGDHGAHDDHGDDDTELGDSRRSTLRTSLEPQVEVPGGGGEGQG